MEFLSPGNNMSNAQCMLIRACGLIMLNTVSCVRPQIRVLIKKNIFLISNSNICSGYSKEPSHRDGSYEHPNHIVKLMG